MVINLPEECAISLFHTNRDTTKNIRLYHYPCRSFEQFERKIVNGGLAIKNNSRLPSTMIHHWREWYEAYEKGKLADIYAALGAPQRVIRMDDTMARYFEREKAGVTHL